MLMASGAVRLKNLRPIGSLGKVMKTQLSEVFPNSATRRS
jgi:hypothetical protein